MSRIRNPYHSKLRISGTLLSNPYCSPTKKGQMFCMFSVVYGPVVGQREIIFNFVSFGNVAEYIKANFKRGDFITILEAYGLEPYDKNENRRDFWKIRRLMLEGGEILDQEATEEEDPLLKGTKTDETK